MAVRDVDVDLPAGEVTALMGRNGSGKSSLLWALQGTGPRQAGTVDVGGGDPGSLSPGDARRLVTLVPQSPTDLLPPHHRRGGVRAGRCRVRSAAGTCRSWLERLVEGVEGEANPRDLSKGSAWHSRWRSSSRGARRWSCSTSRPEARPHGQGAPWRRAAGVDRQVMPWRWPPRRGVRGELGGSGAGDGTG
ncbi:MAG: ABC transporter ATP-binding protein [Microthrixaceae bacterium]|nr:ABC transporter ATP-binding protein [Microthrixaceae bacterium]